MCLAQHKVQSTLPSLHPSCYASVRANPCTSIAFDPTTAAPRPLVASSTADANMIEGSSRVPLAPRPNILRHWRPRRRAVPYRRHTPGWHRNANATQTTVGTAAPAIQDPPHGPFKHTPSPHAPPIPCPPGVSDTTSERTRRRFFWSLAFGAIGSLASGCGAVRDEPYPRTWPGGVAPPCACVSLSLHDTVDTSDPLSGVCRRTNNVGAFVRDQGNVAVVLPRMPRHCCEDASPPPD